MLVALTIAAASAAAIPPSAERSDIVVTAHLPGGASLDPAVAAARWTLDGSDLSRGSAGLLRAMDGSLTGVTLNEAQGNPYQPNIVYRGFEASPLGGNAQGLAVYVDGARFNQPFGDIVNWDLIPDTAVARVALAGANSLFGLNSLGGALAVDLKTGRDAPGLVAEASAARFGGRRGSLSGGGVSGGWSSFITAEVQHDDGWRDFSPSTVHRGYAQIGAQGDWGSADLRLTAAETDLTGNGTSPVELLAARRAAVFTYPDRTRNRYGRALLDADIAITDRLRLKPSAHIDRFHQRTVNGDLSEAEPCEDDARLLCLDGDDDVPVTGATGATFAAFADDDATYAQLNRTRTRTTAYGAAIEAQLDAGSHQLAAGSVVQHGRSRFGAESVFGLLGDDRGFVAPQGVIDQADGPIRPVSLITRRADLGLYLADRIRLSDALEATLGLRYNRSRVTLDDQLGSALNGRHAYRRFSPSARLSWRASAAAAFYAGYAETSRAPTPAELSCADEEAPCALSAFFVSDPPLKQVVARTIEMGTRGTGTVGGMRLSWHLGGWRTVSDNDIIFAASAVRSRAFFSNVGQTRRQGIEISVDGQEGPWRARFSYTLTDARYRSPFTINSPDNPGADEDGLIAVARGDRLPGIARHLAKLNLDRRFGESGWLRLTARYASGRWLAGDEANVTRPTAGYFLADASGGVTVDDGIELFGEVRNLLGKRYATFGAFAETSAVRLSEAPGATDPRALTPGTPRQWLIGGRARF